MASLTWRSGAASPCKQLCVLLQKRAVCAKRDRKGLFLQHALPVLLVALTMLVLLVPDPRVGPRRLLIASLYPRLETRLGECLGSV